MLILINHFFNITQMFHFVLEFIETNVKFTEYYFNIKRKITIKIQNKMKGKYYKNILMLLLSSSFSSLHQYRTNKSMDICVRFYASILLSINISFYYFVSLGYSEWQNLNMILDKNTYDKAKMLMIIYTIQDAIHYIITFMIAFKYMNFNIIKPFVIYIKIMSTSLMHLFIVFIIYSSAYFLAIK